MAIVREQKINEGKRVREQYLLIPLLLPLGNQVCIRIAVFQKPVVELFRYSFLLVVQVIYISRA